RRRARADARAPRRRLDVDVVDADAGPPDHLQPLGPVDQVLRQLRRRPDDDRVVAADDLGELRLAADVDLEPGAEQLDAGVGDLLADENLHTRAPPAYASSA